MAKELIRPNLFKSTAIRFVTVLLTMFAGVLFASARENAEIIMFEQRGCEWCEIWNEEIAPVFPKTPEAKCAKFRRVDIHQPGSDILERIDPVVYTPTFVVMENGKEVGRVRGYAGEDFFWFHLDQQLKKLTPPCSLPN